MNKLRPWNIHVHRLWCNYQMQTGIKLLHFVELYHSLDSILFSFATSHYTQFKDFFSLISYCLKRQDRKFQMHCTRSYVLRFLEIRHQNPRFVQIISDFYPCKKDASCEWVRLCRKHVQVPGLFLFIVKYENFEYIRLTLWPKRESCWSKGIW